MSLGAGRVFVSEMGEEEEGEIGQQGQLCRSRESGDQGRGQDSALGAGSTRPGGQRADGGQSPRAQVALDSVGLVSPSEGSGSVPHSLTRSRESASQLRVETADSPAPLRSDPFQQRGTCASLPTSCIPHPGPHPPLHCRSCAACEAMSPLTHPTGRPATLEGPGNGWAPGLAAERLSGAKLPSPRGVDLGGASGGALRGQSSGRPARRG